MGLTPFHENQKTTSHVPAKSDDANAVMMFTITALNKMLMIN
jgi:hypothetical protein